MKKTKLIILTSAITTQLIFAESPAVITPPIITPEISVCPMPEISQPHPEVSKPIIDPTPELLKPVPNWEYNTHQYSVELLNKKSKSICEGVVIAPSWVLSIGSCTKNTKYVSIGTIEDEVKVEKKFFFKKKREISLLKIQNKPFNPNNSLQLLSEPLLAEYGVLDYIKISHNIKEGLSEITENFRFIIKNKNILEKLEIEPKIEIDNDDENTTITTLNNMEKKTEGSPWVVLTDEGEIGVALSSTNNNGLQIAKAQKWINNIVTKYTPTEKVKWTNNIDTILESQ